MSKVVSREKDTRVSSAAASSSRAKPSSTSQPQNTTQQRSENKSGTSQAPASFIASKASTDSTPSVSKTSSAHDMRAHEWKNFFLDSGIPDHAAMEYAGIFVKERINWQILKNLDKGYLTDMGINCIGDQIAILQAAKKYCGEQYAPGQPKPVTQTVMRMDVDEVHTGSPRQVVANNGAAEAPEKVTVLSTVSRLSPKKAVRNEVSSTTAVRSIVQNPRNPGESVILLRGKRSAEEDDQDRIVLKKISTQPSRQVRPYSQLPVDDTNFTVRLGSGAGVKRGNVFSRLSQKGTKSTSNNNLVRVLETRMSRLSTGPSSGIPSTNGGVKPTLVSDSMAAPTPVFNRLGASNASRSHSVPGGRSAGSSVFSRLGYQSKAKTGGLTNPGGDSRNKLSVHDRLGTRR